MKLLQVPLKYTLISIIFSTLLLAVWLKYDKHDYGLSKQDLSWMLIVYFIWVIATGILLDILSKLLKYYKWYRSHQYTISIVLWQLSVGYLMFLLAAFGHGPGVYWFILYKYPVNILRIFHPSLPLYPNETIYMVSVAISFIIYSVVAHYIEQISLTRRSQKGRI